jgi:hypothetical protein
MADAKRAIQSGTSSDDLSRSPIAKIEVSDGRQFSGATVTGSTDVRRAVHHKTNLANPHFAESSSGSLMASVNT